MKHRGPIEIKRFTITRENTVSRIVQEIRKSYAGKSNSEISRTVTNILSQIRTGGDEALIKLANRFDHSNLRTSEDLFVSQEEIDQAYSKVKRLDILALKKSYEQIKWLARKQMQRFNARRYRSLLGFTIDENYVPLARIGGYIPGGGAAYPSTVLMICATAREAGVKEVILATSAVAGKIEPSVLVAADICGVKEIMKAGGSQAIAALAFGTESVKKVELISGPGNEYVTEAKRQVSSIGEAAIDLLAGPTEILIIADASADPKLIFADLISQAEHGNKTLCGLISDSPRIVRAVLDLAEKVSNLAREEKIMQSTMFVILSPTHSKSVEFAQAFAPEHLEFITSKSSDKKFTRSGLVLSGKFAPCAATDYIVGTNHILPTGGTASRSSGLSVESFLKRVTSVRGSKKSLEAATRFISSLANLEGLPNHGIAAKARFEA